MDNLAIAVHNLGKKYKLYRKPADKILDVFGLSRFMFWRKHFAQEFWALRGLNLEVPKGERLGIIGQNGAGKSTLLKIILGTLCPTEGDVRINGRIQALMELGTGFHPEFTGRENIRASLAYQGLPRAKILEKEEEIIDLAEVGDFIEQPVKTYSAGMYARLAFSTATSIEPEILIIDEILGAGDAYFVGKCMERMKALTEQSGTTVLFVSHDVSSVQRLSTRAIWVKAGRIHRMGTPMEVVRDYLEFQQKENELRLRARDMKLSKKHARVVVETAELFERFLFRLRAVTPHPKMAHPIYRVALHLNGKQESEIHVGHPMDNNTNDGNHLIADPLSTDWSPSKLNEGNYFREFVDRKSRDGHAPFVMSVPKIQLAGEAKLTLCIEHQAKSGEPILVEVFQQGKYHSLGSIEGSGGHHQGINEFTVPWDNQVEKEDKAAAKPAVAAAPAPEPAPEPAKEVPAPAPVAAQEKGEALPAAPAPAPAAPVMAQPEVVVPPPAPAPTAAPAPTPAAAPAPVMAQAPSTTPPIAPNYPNYQAELTPAEIEALAEESPTLGLNDHEDKHVRILGVDFLLPDGRDVKLVPRASPVRVRLRYLALTPVHNPVFAITFHRADGVQMDHQNTKLLGLDLGLVQGEGAACFDFNPFRIGSGDYFVTAAILKYLDIQEWYDMPPAYDRHDRQYCLKVFVGPDDKEPGQVVQESTFTLQPAALPQRKAG